VLRQFLHKLACHPQVRRWRGVPNSKPKRGRASRRRNKITRPRDTRAQSWIAAWLAYTRIRGPRAAQNGLAFTVPGVIAQGAPPLSGTQAPPAVGTRQAPIGHRQPTPSGLPPDVRKEEEPNALQSQPQSQAQPSTKSRSQSRQQSARVRGGGGPPVLRVGPSCEAAGRGEVVLGRNKESCLADETAALNTLKQNWSKRQDFMHRHGVRRRPGKLCRATVLS
jgi:hypothetical protein